MNDDVRQSIEPTYDHRETGDRFTVEYRVNDRRLDLIPLRDPFVTASVMICWRDLVGFALRGRKVTIIVSGDPGIVDDVMELDADCLTDNSTRRREWNEHVERSLRGNDDMTAGTP